MTKPATSKDLKAAVEKHMAAHPDWTFARAWQELKRTNPEFFTWQDFEKPADRLAAWKRGEEQRQANNTQSADNPVIAQAKRLFRAVACKDLKDKVQRVMAAEGLSFQAAWTELKRREPQAFDTVQAVEDGSIWPAGIRRLEASRGGGRDRPAPIRVTRHASEVESDESGEVMMVQGVADPWDH